MIFAFSNDEPEYDGSFVRGKDHEDFYSKDSKGLKTWNMEPDDLNKWNKFLKERDEYEAKVEAGPYSVWQIFWFSFYLLL